MKNIRLGKAVSMMKDYYKLQKIYFKLKAILAEVYEIELRHEGAGHLKEILDSAMDEIDDAAHKIFGEAYELKEIEDNE